MVSYCKQPPQQVKSPEAAYETRFTPGGESVETSTVALGSKVSFYSVTPGATLTYAKDSYGNEFEKIPADGVTVEGSYGSNFIVRVQAEKEGMIPSEIITFVYKIADQELANAPTATPSGVKPIITIYFNLSLYPFFKVKPSSSSNGT